MRRPALYCLLSALLFGIAPALCKGLVAPLGELGLAGLLYLGAALAVAPLSFKGGSRARRREPMHVAAVIGVIIFGGILGPVLLLAGLARAQAGSVSLWLNLETVATAVLGVLFFKEELGRRTWLAVLFILLASTVLTGADWSANMLPALLITAACLCWGLDNSLTAIIDGFTPAQVTFIKGLVAGSFNLGLSFWLGESPQFDSALIAQALAVGAACYGVSILLYVHGAQELGATRGQLIFSSAPFIGLVYAWIVLGESVAIAQLAAAAMMIGGLALLLTGSHRHRHAHSSVIHSHTHSHDDGHHMHRHEGEALSLRHTHEHSHEPVTHEHEHLPDLHHRHEHTGEP